MATSKQYDVVIVGAGISGLCTAHWLKKRGLSVLVLERDAEVGGTMKSKSHDGFLSESGPNSALETTPLFKELVADLHLENEFIYATPAGKNRFILKNGELHALPLGPASFLMTPLFSVGAKLRLLLEPFIGRATKEESIAQFVERRLGKEFLRYAIDPFVAGVYAGKPDRLSVRAAFPKLYALEEKYGGLIRGMIGGARERKKRAEKAKDRAETFAFRSGMQVFPQALSRSLGKSVLCNADVKSIAQTKKNLWQVSYGLKSKRGVQSLFASKVVIATPANAASGFVRPISKETSETLKNIYYPPVASVFVAYRRSQIARELNGFGFLIPTSEQRKILGALWSSSLFPNRAPEDAAAFTIFVGGSRQPELAQLDRTSLVQMALGEFQSIMQIHGKPLYCTVTRWKNAIPQYELGYPDVVKKLHEFERQHAGIVFCSNFIGGISVGDCVTHAREVADRIAGEFNR